MGISKLFALFVLFVLSLFFAGLLAENTVYRVAIDPETGEEVTRVEVVNYCYEFTWLGPEDEESTNITSSCEDITSTVEYAGLPCFEPLVWTTGENAQNGPNLTQIEQQCESSDTIDGTACDPLCLRQEKTCVKMTYYSRDDSKTIRYQTRFCGTGMDTSDNGKVITDGCHTQDHDIEYDIEACFCEDGDRCNGGGRRQMHLLMLVVAVAVSAIFNL